MKQGALASLAALALLSLAGCTLIDQRTFEKAGKTPSAEDVKAASLPPLPLLTIRFGGVDIEFRPAVAQAVDAVNIRRPGASFDVLAVVPTYGDPAVLERSTMQGQQDALAVATALQENGVMPDRIQLGLRSDPGNPPREVMVFIR